MKLAICVLALAVFGADDQTANRAPHRKAALEACQSACEAAASGIAKVSAPKALEVWPMRLREAFRMGLENSGSVRRHVRGRSELLHTRVLRRPYADTGPIAADAEV